jgi:hypothetical protein
MNMMRKNNNRGGNNQRRGSGGGQRRYTNNGGGNNRSSHNDSQNLQRQKHHATQQLGKYNDLARNAQGNGDRVDVEYYLQHVDHYTRVLTDIAAVEAERHAHHRESQIIPGGPNDPNAAQNQGGEAAPTDAAADSTGDASQAGDSQSERAARPHRRSHYGEPAVATDNGAKEANRNTTDIPLPGSILPPI